MKKFCFDRQDRIYQLAELRDDCIDTADIPETPPKAWRHTRQPRPSATVSTALAVEELDEETLKALTGSRMDFSHDRLNPLMD